MVPHRSLASSSGQRAYRGGHNGASEWRRRPYERGQDMINIATVHWRSPKWIGVQLDYLERSIDAPFRVFGALNGIEDGALWDRFDFAEDMEGGHPEKLNALPMSYRCEVRPVRRADLL